jgi:methanogenic corrinoid protein MtbC1
MTSVRSSEGSEASGHSSADSSAENGLTTLIYRSRAKSPMTESELYRILDTARARNHAAGVTGLLIYDNCRFFQWLEGPTDAVEAIWRSIRADKRHTDIEVLGEEAVPARLFGEWEMKLGLQHPCSDGRARDTMTLPPGLIESLDRNPDSANYFLATLAPVQSNEFANYMHSDRDESRRLHSSREGRPASKNDDFVPVVLNRILGMEVIPALVRRHPLMTPDLQVDAIHPGVAELARRLVASEPEAAFELIDQLQTGTGSIAKLCASYFEPAARALGDLWSNDDCTELDVSLGMNQLQMAVRRRNIALVPIAFHGSPMPAVLVATQPGEIHSLTATLDAEVLWHDGWDTHCEHPETDDELNEMVATHWFDALDLSLSAAFRHEDWLPRMAKTIAQARKASRNPSLVVVVGGRVFHEQADAAKRVGADAGVANSQEIGPVILEALRKKS